MERRQTPRSRVALECILTRKVGNPIAATTVEVGLDGMSVATKRPLAVDEELGFELPTHLFPGVSGRARVLRDQGSHIYGMRFEQVPEHLLADLASSAWKGGGSRDSSREAGS